MGNKGKSTKKELQDKAFELFENRGYDNVTIDEICTELGLTKGAFYYYFKSKSDLLLKSYRNTEGDLMTFYNNCIHLPADEQLRAIFDWYLNHFRLEDFQNATIMLPIQSDYSGKGHFIPHTTQRIILENILNKGKQKGCFTPTIHSSEIAHFIYTYLIGLACLWSYYQKNIDIEVELNNFYFNILLPMLKAPSAF